MVVRLVPSSGRSGTHDHCLPAQKYPDFGFVTGKRKVVRRVPSIFFFFLLLVGRSSFSGPHEHNSLSDFELVFRAKAEIPGTFKFENVRFGGISGLVRHPETKTWFAVSDDRGKFAEPRMYELDFVWDGTAKLEVKVKRGLVLKEKEDRKKRQLVRDLEGITILPWSNFLLSSEGDGGKIPRQGPVLLDVKMDGSFVRSYDFPADYLPTPTGPLKNGTQNNRGPEGLTSFDDGRLIWAAIESPLAQERSKNPPQVRIQQFEMAEAWVIKPTKSYIYPVVDLYSERALSDRGVSEILAWDREILLVLERGAEISTEGLNFHASLFRTALNSGTPLQKQLLVDFKDPQGARGNLEGMSWGPQTSPAQRTLVLVTDNNFEKKTSTEFFLYEFVPRKLDKGPQQTRQK